MIPNVQVSQQRMFVTPGPSSRSASVMGAIQTHPNPMAAAAFPTYRPPLQQQQPQIHHHHTVSQKVISRKKNSISYLEI